ncbi:MAG TPA: hydrogenase iron-sulfur subunit [bacterium]|mgnify:CR=1 FL=1|nr:hydrogenase iron-sulfur subunit [bacterium]HPN31129.1 hydrogenase iron-sulfur subunit [bacterium]
MSKFEPKIVAFVCNWCSYGGADNAGNKKLKYPANVKLIRVMCSGRVDTKLVLKTFKEGADGVMVLGCHPGDCHYRSGNLKAEKRFRTFEKFLEKFGIEKERFFLDWVSASEGEKFQKVISEMTDKIKLIGQLHLSPKTA